MLETFEIKSYPQLNFALGVVNGLLMLGVVLGLYFFVLTPAHQQHVQAVANALPLIRETELIPLSLLSIVWGWIATVLLRLHDRVHEPHLRKWRANYDVDFILRSLCLDIMGLSEEFFSRAYADRRFRTKAMQRLFYNFIGDETTTAAGRRIFFYTEMWKYWLFALSDLYSSCFLVTASVYHISIGTMLSPIAVLVSIAIVTICRVFQNKILDAAHEVTEDQIAAVKRNHAQELKREAVSLATDIGA